MQALPTHYNIYYRAFLSYRSHKMIYDGNSSDKILFDLKKDDFVYQNTSYIYLLFFKTVIRLILSQ